MRVLRCIRQRLWIATALLALCILLSFTFIHHPPRVRFDGSYPTTLSVALDAVSGKGPVADLAQDIVGLRAMLAGENAYPVLAPAFKERLGLQWNVNTNSTHPPSAFLLTFPVAFLPWPRALQTWSMLMLACTFGSLLLLRLPRSWLWAAFAMMLIWPPLLLSLGQLTAIWLLGFCIAYRYREERPVWSGVGAGLAAATKLTPVVLIAPFLYPRNKRGLLGFALLAVMIAIALLVLSPDAIRQYVASNAAHTAETLERFDNGSLLAVTHDALGLPGTALALLYLLLVILCCLPRLRDDENLRWMFAGYMGVAILPIAWCYSLLPLAPILLYFLRSRQIPSIACAALAFGLPFFAPMGSEISARITAAAIVLTGLGFVIFPLERAAIADPPESQQA